MASVPGGPPMASGAVDPGQDGSNRDGQPAPPGHNPAQPAPPGHNPAQPAARPRGPRVQLFRDQPPAGSPDGAASASASGPKAPPPDVIQSQMGYRQPDVFVDNGGSASMLSFNSSLIGQRSTHPGSQAQGYGMGEAVHLYMPDDNPGPEGQEALSACAALPKGVSPNRSGMIAPDQRPDLDISLGFAADNENLYEELRSVMMTSGHNGAAASTQLDQGHNTAGHSSGHYATSLGSQLVSTGHHTSSHHAHHNIQSLTNQQPATAAGSASGSIQITAPEDARDLNYSDYSGPSNGRHGLVVSQAPLGSQVPHSSQPALTSQPSLRLYHPDQNQLQLRLSPEDGFRTGNDSMESGMFPRQGDPDLSEEFLPLENEEPEGAGSSSQSTEEDQYEDNTEVDQDVVLQPEADQTSYDDENDEVEGHVSREAHFIPIQVPHTGNVIADNNNPSNPALHPNRNVTTNQADTYQRSLIHISTGLEGPQGQPVSVPQVRHQPQLVIDVAKTKDVSESDHINGNGNTNPEEDQVDHQQETQAQDLINSEQNRQISQPRTKQTNPAASQLLTAGHRVSQSLPSRLGTSPTAPQVPTEHVAGGQASSRLPGIKQPAQRGPASGVTGTSQPQAAQPKSGSTAGGSTAGLSTVGISTQGVQSGKQHTESGAIPKSLKPAPAHSGTSSRRTKIRTVPPKTAGSAKPALNSTKARPHHNTSRTKSVAKPSKASPRTAPQPSHVRPGTKGSTNAKSPNRAPPRRLAPSGGDSSTAPVPPPSQGQGQLPGQLAQAIQGGHYMLPTQQLSYGLTGPHSGMLVSSSGVIPTPSRDHNRDGADGFMRPNPIGETDSGVRGFQPGPGQQYQSNGHQNMVAVRPYNQNLLHNPATDGDGDEAASSLNPGPVFSLPAPVMHTAPVGQPVAQVGFRPPNNMDRHIPGTSLPQPTSQLQIAPPGVSLMSDLPIDLPRSHYQQGTSHQHMQTAHQGGTVVYNANSHTQHAANSTQLSNNPGNHLGHKSDPYGAWDRTPELSPISRTSGATDRIQHSPSTVYSRDVPSTVSSRDVPHNLSFTSTASDKTAQNDSSMLTTDIVHMEQLRNQIKDMLKMTGQVLPDKGSYDQTTGELVAPGDGMIQDDTSGLVMAGKVLSDLAPDLDAVFNHSSRYFGGGATSGVPSQQMDTSSLRAENQNLKEVLEKEKFRRKHCEKQIAGLQTKVLELQQQLAVAVSTDRKKDIMIEQLDKTLAQVVDGWKKKEAEKQQVIQTVQQENTEMKTKQRQQQELLERFERDLTETVDQLAQEQQRSKVTEEEQSQKLQSQQQEIGRLSQVLEKEHQRALSLDSDKSRLEVERENLDRKLKDLQLSYEGERENWDEKEREYLQKVDEITNNHLTKMEEEKKRHSEQAQAVADLQSALSTAQKDVHGLQLELDSAHREKESLKVQMGLLEAKSESQLRKLQAELQADFEKQICERLEEERQQASSREDESQERHRRQIQELTQRHQQELDAQLQRHQGELWRCDDARKRELQDKDDKIELYQQEIDDLKTSNKQLEQQRVEMTHKLQSMMQSHCNEALRLLQMGSQALSFSKEGGFSALYSGISTLQHPQMPGISMTTATMTTTTTSDLRSSVLESVPNSSSEQTHVQKYLHSLDKQNPTRNVQEQTIEGSTEYTKHEEDRTVTFSDLSDLLNQSVTSELTQIPFHGQSPPSVLDTSHISSVSQSTRPQHPAGPQLQDSVFSQDSKLLNLFKSLPTTQTVAASSGGYGHVFSQANSSTSEVTSDSQKASGPHHTHHHGNQGNLHSNIPQTQPIPSLFNFSDAKPTNQNTSSSAPAGATIMLHPPVQRDHITMATHTHNSSHQSGSSGSAPSGGGVSVPDHADHGSHFEPLVPHNMSMNTTASSDWGYPALGGTTNSLFSHILQEHMSSGQPPPALGDNRGNNQHDVKISPQTDPTGLAEPDSELDSVEHKFQQHESRQNELQHYIRMLLQRSPGSPVQAADTTVTEEQTTPPKKQTKSSAFSKTTVTGSHTGAAPGGPSVTMDTSGVKATTGTNLEEASSILTPEKVSEISRLLGLYGRQTDPGTEIAKDSTSHNPPVEELLVYLRDLQIRNENLNSPPNQQIPTRDKKTRTPPSPSHSRHQGASTARQTSPTRHSQGAARAKRSQESAAHSNPAQKYVIKIPSATEQSSQNKTAVPKQQNNVTAATKPSQSQPKKSMDRKTAPPGKNGAKVWK